MGAVAVAGTFLTINSRLKSERIQENLSAGKQYYDNQEYKSAIEYFDMVLDDNSQSVEAYYFKTNSLKALEDLNSAVAVVEYGYKVTDSQILKNLRDKIVTDVTVNPTGEEQLVVSNFIADAGAISSESISESVKENKADITTQKIDFTPDVDIPKRVPKMTTKEENNQPLVTIIIMPSEDDKKEESKTKRETTAISETTATDVVTPSETTITDIETSSETTATDVITPSETTATDVITPSETTVTDITTEETTTSEKFELITDEEYEQYRTLFDKFFDKIMEIIEKIEDAHS